MVIEWSGPSVEMGRRVAELRGSSAKLAERLARSMIFWTIEGGQEETLYFQ